MRQIEHAIERFLFNSRWLLAPFYIGLVFALVLLLFHFIMEFVAFRVRASGMPSEREVILGILGLIDLSFTGNLVLIVIFSGYENFVSKINIDVDEHDRPDWMTKVDFGGLKQKADDIDRGDLGGGIAQGIHEYREVRSDAARLARRHPCGVPAVLACGRALGPLERADETSVRTRQEAPSTKISAVRALPPGQTLLTMTSVNRA